MFLRLELIRSVANEGLDAAHTGGNGSLAKHRHTANMARRGHVGATAQLTVEAIADCHDANLGTVLFAEESDCAHLLGLLDAHDLRCDGEILSELLINKSLNVVQLRSGKRARVTEVKTQARRRVL